LNHRREVPVIRGVLRWVKHAANPIFVPNPKSDWEKHKVTACQIERHDDWHYMFYIGFRDERSARIGIARSRDDVTQWERHPANPPNGSFPAKHRWSTTASDDSTKTSTRADGRLRDRAAPFFDAPFPDPPDTMESQPTTKHRHSQSHSVPCRLRFQGRFQRCFR
jgi:hypothetical protein